MTEAYNKLIAALVEQSKVIAAQGALIQSNAEAVKVIVKELGEQRKLSNEIVAAVSKHDDGADESHVILVDGLTTIAGNVLTANKSLHTIWGGIEEAKRNNVNRHKEILTKFKVLDLEIQNLSARNRF